MKYRSIVIFNTGKPYTKDGQIIGAALLEDGGILFYDVSRLICGRIDSECFDDELGSLKDYVHRMYLNNHYEPATMSEVEELGKKIRESRKLAANESTTITPEIMVEFTDVIHGRVIESINKITVPDLWHLHLQLKEQGETIAAQAVLQTWHLAHDFKTHIIEKS